MAQNPKYSLLDPGQIIKRVYDEDNDVIRTTGSGGGGGPIECIISQEDDSISIGDGTTLFTGTDVGSDHGLDVNIIGGVVSGTFTPTGLKDGVQVYVITVTDSPTLIPFIADQNGISMRIWGANTIYFGPSTLTAATGYPKLTKEEISIDIQNNANTQLYAVCDTGLTCELRVFALA